MRASDAAAVLLAAVLLAGCGERAASFVELDVRDRTDPPEPVGLDVRLESDEITLVEGIAIGARVSAIDDTQAAMPVLSLRASDEGVFEVRRGPTLGHYVLYGIEPGEAELEVSSDGRQVGTLPVQVVVQPSQEAR